MNKFRLQTKQNRIDILKQCYYLMAQDTWDAISVSKLEKNISQTRGAIFYFNKNKSDLFINMINELFFPIFVLSDGEKERLKRCSISQFHTTYKTPFERVKEDLENNYKLPNAAQAVFNIIIQAQKHYTSFNLILMTAINNELSFISNLTSHNNHELFNYTNILIYDIGNLFINSLEEYPGPNTISNTASEECIEYPET